MSTDFKNNVTLGTPSGTSVTAAKYDVAVYDTDMYALDDLALSDWQSISNQGHSGSIHFRGQTTDASNSVTLRLNGFDSIFRVGGLM